MKKHMLFLMALLTVSTSYAHLPDWPGCEHTEKTMERVACRSKQMETADKKLEKYLKEAKKQVKLAGLKPSLLDVEQRAWTKYIESHCGNVYLFWQTGSLRYEQSAICTLELTRARTSDIWRAYLTFMDSTPPLLPDPATQEEYQRPTGN